MKKKLSLLAIVGSFLALGTTSSTALADTPGSAQRTVGIVEFGGPNLTIQLSDGTNYLATRNASSALCSVYNVTPDTLKIWQGMAEAALLSGKMLKIYYTTCSADNLPYITTVDLDV